MSTATLRRALGWSVVVLGAVVAVSGVGGWLEYHPKATGTAAGFSRVHHWSALGLAVLGVAWCLVTIVDGRRQGVTRRLAPLVTFLGAVLVALAAWVTGPLLAWDQVALWAVTVGFSVDGVWFDGLPVKFVVVDGREFSVASFRQAALVHAGSGVLVAAALVTFAAAWHVRRRPAPFPAVPAPPAGRGGG